MSSPNESPKKLNDDEDIDENNSVIEQDMDNLRSSTVTPSIDIVSHQDKKFKTNDIVKSATSTSTSANTATGQSKKVPLHLLEKRRLGRIKAAEEFAKKLKQVGINKIDNDNIFNTGKFKSIQLINQKNYSSDYLKKDDQIFTLRERKFLRNKIIGSNDTTTNDNNTSTNGQWNDQDYKDLADTTFNNKSIKYNHEQIDLNDPSNTIVIQLGHTSLKIGFALDETPIVVPNCIAIPTDTTNETDHNNEDNWFHSEQSQDFIHLKSQLYQSFKERMRYYKRRIQPNSHDQVKSFNSQSNPEIVSLQKDPAYIPWITNENSPIDSNSNSNSNLKQKYLYGDEAILASEPWFKHRKPFASDGSFNLINNDYTSLQELLGDVTNLLNYALKKLFKRYRDQLIEKQKQQEEDNDEEESTDTTSIKKINFESQRFKAILIIPDLFQKSHVETMIRLLITELPFQAVAIIQESLANCYGAGLGTSTCVVNIGSSSTNVVCVDEGSVVENSVIKLDYGGDDITRLFSVLLKQNNFPYHEWDPNTVAGWYLAETLKKNLVTFQDDGVAVQLTNFLKRMPNEPIEKYEFKIFDEVMLAPLALFYPEIFKLLKINDVTKNEKLAKNYQNLKLQLPASQDFFTDDSNDLNSISQEESLHDSNLTSGETPDAYTDIHNELILLKKLLNVNEKLDNLIPMTPDDTILNMLPLDKAIIQSITNGSITMDPSKMSTYYSNILVVGGSSNIEAFDFMLTDRINIWRPRLLAHQTFPTFYENLVKKIKEHEKKFNTEKSKPTTTTTTNDNDDEKIDENKDSAQDENDVIIETDTTTDSKSVLQSEIDSLINEELQKFVGDFEKSANNNDHYSPVTVIPPPREMDPASLCWKGGSVLAQVKLVEELFITYSDWDMHGSRILQYKCIFPY